MQTHNKISQLVLDEKASQMGVKIIERKDYNVCIEFQGEQHYRSVDFSYTPTKESKKKAEKKFVEIQKRDKIKKEYCKNKGIKLLLITYKQIKQIESILIKELNLSTVTTAGCSQ